MIEFPHLEDPPGGEIELGNTTELTLEQLLSRYPNWQFDPNLLGWEKTGTAFDNQPTYGNNVMMNRGAIPVRLPLRGSYWRKTSYPIGQKGVCWVGTFDARPSHNQDIPIGTTQGDGPTGTLTSKPFVIDTNYITFLIGGGKDLANLKVELLRAGPTGFVPVPGTARTGMNSEVFRREWWDVRGLRGQEARIRITDNASGPWGHINVDDFRFQDTSPLETMIYIGDRDVPQPQVVAHLIHPGEADSRAYIDYDAPVWGVADLHAHPASHLGFGATFHPLSDELNQMGIFWGKPGGAYTAAASTIATDLAPCDPKTHSPGLEDPIKHLVRMTVLSQVNTITGYPHASGGWPDFRNWPSAYSIQHQQMHITWIRRAYEGGLRLMIASVTDNQTFNLLWGRALDLDIPDPVVGDPSFDKPKARKMLNFIKELARQNADWMEVVTKPEDARRAIRQGKLALILGLEMDQLTADDILELKEEGVRHVIPIHLADNHFGGCAVFSDPFNTHNYILNRRWLSVKGDSKIKFRLGHPKKVVGFIFGLVMPMEIGKNEYRELRYLCDEEDLEPGCIPEDMGHRNIKPPQTEQFVRLMRAGLMVDLVHMSQDAQEAVLQLSERFGYPLNNSHTKLRPETDGEYERYMLISHARRMAAQGGVLGLSTGVKPEPLKLVSIKPATDDEDATVACFEPECPAWTISVHRVDDRAATTQFNVVVHVGSDDLDEGIRAFVSFHMNQGGPYVKDLNYGAKWEARSVHRISVELESPISLQDIRSIAVHGAGLTQNWTLDRLEIQPGGVGWLDLRGSAGLPLARFSKRQEEHVLYTGDNILSERVINRLGFVLRTGDGHGDAMRSSSLVHADILFRDGRVSTFPLKEEGSRWLKKSMYMPVVQLPEGTKRSDIDAIRLRYDPHTEVLSDIWKLHTFEVDAYSIDEDPVGRWVSSYKEALEVMDWHGIGLGTDMNGFVSQVPFTSPVNAITYSTDGTGSALVQHRTGTRAWDFNRDGLAHYGMLPDFFEAISRNSDMTFENMSPLFQSAEAVIQMWEKAERAAVVVRALTLPPGAEMPVGLRSIEQVFLHAGADGALLSSRSPDTSREIFRLTKVRDQFVALRTASGRYVTAVGGESQAVRADATSRGPAETFELVPCGGNRVGLRTRDNRFINLNSLHPGGPVKATSVVAKAWAVFELVPQG
jgi:microsomal dipeptidase-like Zn-dependent dipeptidase